MRPEDADEAVVRLPQGACDCHVHVFDPARFAYATLRSYTPPEASLASLRHLHASLSIARTVLVQPSVYGTDNGCLLAALRTLGSAYARGIAVVDLDRIGQDELERLHACGVRGVRMNIAVTGDGDLESVRNEIATAKRLASLPGWSLQIHASVKLIASLAGELTDIGVPLVFDHYAGANDADSKEVGTVCALMTSGVAYVKLSAPYRVTRADPDRADVGQLARRFYDTAPDRVVWGSDWPHTGGGRERRRDPSAIEPFREENNARAIRQLLHWLPDPAAVHRVFVTNPSQLYGFEQDGA